MYTYRHNTVCDPLAPFEVSGDFVFSSAAACREYVDRCLDDMSKDYVVVEGTWGNGRFVGARVV